MKTGTSFASSRNMRKLSGNVEKIISVLMVLTAIGCGGGGSSSSNSDNENLATAVENSNEFHKGHYEYQLKECEEHPRVFPNQQDMCFNLQVDEFKGFTSGFACAEDVRKKYFDQLCNGLTWNPEAAQKEMFYGTGASVLCLLTEQGEGTTSTVRQRTKSNTMYLQHDHSRAIVTTKVKNDKIRLSVRLFDNKGEVLGRESGSFNVNEVGVPSQNVTISSTHPIQVSISCFPYWGSVR